MPSTVGNVTLGSPLTVDELVEGIYPQLRCYSMAYGALNAAQAIAEIDCG